MKRLSPYFPNWIVLLLSLIVLFTSSRDSSHCRTIAVEAFCIGCYQSPTRPRQQLATIQQHPSLCPLNSSQQSIEKDNEEPLSVIFQRAMVLQRAGSYDEALKSYELFCRAAEQCNVDKSQYSEVLVNMGAIYLKKGDNNSKEQAKQYFTTALKYRQNGMAHVNLAVLNLQQATSSSITTTDLTEGIKCLKTATDERLLGLTPLCWPKNGKIY